MIYFRPIKRGEDKTLEDYGNYLTKKVDFVLKQNTTPGEPNGAYKALWDSTEELRSSDLQSPWPRELMGKVSNFYVSGTKHLNFIAFFSAPLLPDF